MYDEEIENRQKVVDACPIDIYVSSATGRYGYESKLLSYYNAPRYTVRDSCANMMIDSSYSKIGYMPEILDKAVTMEADWIITPDVAPGCDGWQPVVDDVEAVTQEMKGYWLDYVNHEYDGKILVPIQAPFMEHLDRLGRIEIDDFLNWRDDPDFDCPSDDEAMIEQANRRGARPSMTLDLLEKFDGVAIGGLRGLSVEETIETLLRVDDYLDDDKHIHALAPGTDMSVLKVLRDRPDLVDSLDISTPEMAAKNQKMPDNTWTQQKVPMPRGKDVSTLKAMRALEIILMLNYMLSPLCRDDDFELAYQQATEKNDMEQAIETAMKAYNTAKNSGAI